MNQIKQGYKQTKVGIIPDDWDVVKLNEKASIQRGKFSPRPRNDPQYYNGDYPFVQTNDVVNSRGKITTYSQTLNEKGLKVSKLFPKGTILMTIAANIGFTGILNRDMTCPDSLVGIQCKKSLYNQFLNFYFIFNQKRIDYLAEEAAQKNINLSTLNSFNIPLPSVKEQEKIAEILTTCDETIIKQEELIEAKIKQKKALSQKLLSGEVRFGGFNDEWEDIRLGKYIKEISKKNKENIDLVLSVTNKHGFIAQKDYFDKEVASKNTSNYKIVKRGNFAYNPSRINVGSLGLLEEYEIGILSPMYVIFECLKGLNKEYLNYWLNTHNFTGNLYKFLSGSVRDSLAFNDMKLMKIKLPVLKEQEKIVEVLSLVDKEINLLKKELEELKLQKKALMQKLLTGEVRVKV